MNEREEIVISLHNDRVLAHHFLFPHRHKNVTPDFHRHLISEWADTQPRRVYEIFRGAGKSTIAEEALIVMALHREFRYALVIGETYGKAVERLMAIRHELEHNQTIINVYGEQEGELWRENILGLNCGTLIQAFGRGMSIRGEKSHVLNARPDFVFIDDLEDNEAVATPEKADETLKWMNREVIPAMESENCRIRINGTRLKPYALIAKLSEDPEWLAERIPLWRALEGMDTDDENPTLVSAWPDKFPVRDIRTIIRRFRRAGDMNGLTQEYLCRSMDDVGKTFQITDIPIDKPQPAFAPHYLVVDPARTRDRKNARTGYCVGSYLGNTLSIPAAYGKHQLPSEIIAEIFALNEEFRPIYIGVERDGLEEWLNEPLRAGMLKRGIMLPLRPLRAARDKNKNEFIKGLQPFIAAHEIQVTNPARCQDLLTELALFPQGTNDVLNALAYFPQLRGGEPVYPEFGLSNVDIEDTPRPGRVYCVFNGDAEGGVAVIACLHTDATLTVLEDFVFEPTHLGLKTVFIAAREHDKVTFMALPDLYKATGGPLLGLLRRAGYPVIQGPKPETGSLSVWLRERTKDRSALTVSVDAHRTINALSGGYRHKVGGEGLVFDAPVDSVYCSTAEALESLVQFCSVAGVEDNIPMTRDSRGQEYISLRR